MAANYNVIVKSEMSENYQNISAEDNQEIYCICRSSFIETFMIFCDSCHDWFHGDCIGLTEESADYIDIYVCPQCSISNSNLRTTFKTKNQRKRISKKRQKQRKFKRIRTSKNSDFSVTENTEFSAKVIAEKIDNDNHKDDSNSSFLTLDITSNSNMNDEKLAQIFQVDTTRRKAKTIACKYIKEHNDSLSKIAKKTKQKKETVSSMTQCYGPGCTNAARKDSKYCCDDCGLKLGTNRILEILPQRLQQRKIIPCAADEISRKKLAVVRRQQKIFQMELEQIDTKIMQLSQLVHKSKTNTQNSGLGEDFEDDNSTMDCKLCGLEISIRLYVKHLEICYKKQERRTFFPPTTMKPDDLEWNIFCNQKISRQGYCKQLRVLCPIHVKESRNEDEACGYPLVMDLSRCTGTFCGRLKKNCHRHPNCWEEIFRAELDMEKLQLVHKLNDLDNEELELRKEMAARGNLMGLMLHQTILH